MSHIFIECNLLSFNTCFIHNHGNPTNRLRNKLYKNSTNKNCEKKFTQSIADIFNRRYKKIM
ncbi:Hypothetical protein GbCGDNIH2_1895 [Granulibacter bethesdensis]|uniref:Uncharacterized protein n=2 Tax=Granulibacter bethesdensis TaxID=364410 RepID=Q0BQV9_GRABC|nr:Hypothetical protein GbCGDNIH1_1895 [Granulibacter bethesdensis CGDNIH1]AHJ68257.1 Hypothetical protein GbCGDNIH2_1895 [Granulibacter bethesdensis]APH65346.1 Hypothetical protein GbCGDNIH1I4_1895 [Granulibacter bethesdensis]